MEGCGSGTDGLSRDGVLAPGFPTERWGYEKPRLSELETDDGMGDRCDGGPGGGDGSLTEFG
jgi:hypothetical protein